MAPLLAAWGKDFRRCLPSPCRWRWSSSPAMSSPAPGGVAPALAAVQPALSPRSAVAFVTVLALLSSWLNWGSRWSSQRFWPGQWRRGSPSAGKVDYRALAAASFLGLGGIWAQGLSGSAALDGDAGRDPRFAGPHRFAVDKRDLWGSGGGPERCRARRCCPLSRLIFLWQSLVSVLIETLVVTGRWSG